MAAKVDKLLRTIDTGNQIRARAQQIVRKFQHIGLFEWAAFAAKFKWRVRLFLGPSREDWVQLPNSNVMPGLVTICWPVAFVAFCSLLRDEASGQRELRVQDHQQGNRFVILREFKGPMAFPQADPKMLRSLMYQEGFEGEDTNSDGDCGIEAMAYWLGKGNDAESLASVRIALAEEMLKRCDDPEFQATWLMCGEASNVLLPETAFYCRRRRGRLSGWQGRLIKQMRPSRFKLEPAPIRFG